MAFISATGTGSAAPTPGWATSRKADWQKLTAALLAFTTLSAATPIAELRVDVTGLRSAKGELRLCLTADPARFPSCVGDARAVVRSVPASQTEVRFAGLPRGDWAVAVIHDANGNARLDTFAGIPREGFGFSNNPPLGFGAPRFAAARFTLGGEASVQQIRMRYLL